MSKINEQKSCGFLTDLTIVKQSKKRDIQSFYVRTSDDTLLQSSVQSSFVRLCIGMFCQFINISTWYF